MRLDVIRRELAQGAEIVTALVVGVSPDEARARPAPGAWSLLEVVGHLLDEELLDAARILIASAGGPPDVRHPDEVVASAVGMARQAADLGADVIMVHPPRAFRGHAISR